MEQINNYALILLHILKIYHGPRNKTIHCLLIFFPHQSTISYLILGVTFQTPIAVTYATNSCCTHLHLYHGLRCAQPFTVNIGCPVGKYVVTVIAHRTTHTAFFRVFLETSVNRRQLSELRKYTTHVRLSAQKCQCV